jgi:Carboxypeptidase regulatory-like domain
MALWLFAALLGVLGVMPPVTPQQPNDGVIEVTVRDSLNKDPVPGARVRFIRNRTPPPNVVTDTTADENGRVVFKDLAAGNYSVTAQQEGYVQNVLTMLTPVTLTLTDTKRKIEFEVLLTRGAIVRGRVLGPDGNPLAKADVSLRALTWVGGRRGVSPLAVGQSAADTDDRGEYSISALPSGEYLLRVELRPTSTGGGQYSSAFDNLSRLTYYPGVPDALIATRISVKAGQEQGGLDIKIPNLKAYRITGTVLNTLPIAPAAPNGRAIPRGTATFFVGSPDPDALEEPVLVPTRLEPTANPDEFTFEIGGIIPGSYYLYPLFGGIPPDLNYKSTRTLVTVKDQDIENLRLTVEPNPEIKGRVLVRGDTSSFNWQNARLGIRAVDRLPILLARPGLASSVVDSTKGEFVFSAFEKGVKFTVSLSGFPPDSYIADLRQGGRSLNSDGIIISDPGEGTVEVTIEQQGGTVEGTVSKPTAAPQERAVVALVPAPSMRGNAMRYYRVLGDAAGKFTIRGIAPGEYKAFAWDGIPGTVAPQNAEFLAPIESKGIALTIRAGSSQTLQLTALPNP